MDNVEPTQEDIARDILVQAMIDNQDAPNFSVQAVTDSVSGKRYTVAVIDADVESPAGLVSHLKHIVELSCCKASKYSNGWHHNPSCEKYVLVE